VPNACFFEIPCRIQAIGSSAVASAVLSGLNEARGTTQCTEDSARYNKTAIIELLGFEPTTCRLNDRSTEIG